MQLSDYIVLGCFILVIALVIFFVIREKKKGKACIGCPHAECCTKRSCQK